MHVLTADSPESQDLAWSDHLDLVVVADDSIALKGLVLSRPLHVLLLSESELIRVEDEYVRRLLIFFISASHQQDLKGADRAEEGL